MHDINDMLGSIDCTDFGWKACPVAWKGQSNWKEKRPIVVMEATAKI